MDKPIRGLTLRHGRIDDGFEMNGFRPAVGAVRGDDKTAAGVEETTRDGVGTEPGEDDVTDGPEARTGEHQNRRHGGHGEIGRDDLPGGDLVVRTERPGHLEDRLVELGVGPDLRLRLLVTFPEKRDACPIATFNVTI